MPRPVMEYDRGYDEDQWYYKDRNYQETREYHDDGSYAPMDHHDRRYYEDSHSYRRNSPPPRSDGSYSQQCYSRDDLRHQLGSRNRGRPGPYYRSRGRGSGPPRRQERSDHRSSPPVAVKRDRSPVSREAPPPAPPSARSGSNTSSRSFSPDRDKGHTHMQSSKKHKPDVQKSHTPSSSVERSPPRSGSSMEKTPTSVAETEEEVAAASMEPKSTPPEEDFKARRLEAIKAKAQEIEKHYRQDCETFRTVVKMLVTKEPSLENVLQAPLDANLLEIKERCLDDLRHFVKELDEAITQGVAGLGHGILHTSSFTHAQTEEDFPKLCSINTTSTDGEREERMQPGDKGDSAQVLAGDQGSRGKQTESTEDSTPVSEICRLVRQENQATLRPEQELLSESSALTTLQGPVEDLTKRLQLYNHRGEKFSNFQLSNPATWRDITYVRPGWVPDNLPYLQVSEQYWELKANSNVFFASTLPSGKGQIKEKVACSVTCYMHVEGPWCEVHAESGARICILAAPPTTRSHL